MRLETKRLLLRQWRDRDYLVYARLNRDPVVMRYFPSLFSAGQSVRQADQLRKHIAEKGWGCWAAELKASRKFIGFIGLNTVAAESGIPHAPMTEICWRLLAAHWGQGYATEGAKLALSYAFEEMKVTEIFSFTALINKPSQRVMIKSGLSNTREEF